MSTERLDEVVEGVRSSAKYRPIHRDVVARVAAGELTAGRTPKEAVKSTRRRLHQVGAVYQSTTPAYAAWLDALRAASTTGDGGELRSACRSIMAAHQSSRERLPILDDLFTDLLAPLGGIRSVLDLACGLNPLAIPWMPLAPDARYEAVDIYDDLAAFLAEALPLLGVEGYARAADVLSERPEGSTPLATNGAPSYDVVFLLKAIPCLEQLERNAGGRLLVSAPSRYVVVSFPTASLGGRRDRGMIGNYRARMEAITAGRGWQTTEHLYPGELAFLVDKGPLWVSGGST